MDTRSKEHDDAKECIANIQSDIRNFLHERNSLGKSRQGEFTDNFFYRGATREYSRKNEENADGISSTIYRNFGSISRGLRSFDPMFEEELIVERARGLFKPGTENIEILTELRHFGADTALIDFTQDLHVALFFACNGNLSEQGELIVCMESDFRKVEKIEYGDSVLTVPFHIKPAVADGSRIRTLAQSSVFLCDPRTGYIDKNLCKVIPIDGSIKEAMLDYLSYWHNINSNTIYNDLPGFITNERNQKRSIKFRNKGARKMLEDKFDDAIGYITKSIEKKPDDYDSYQLRGMAYYKQGKYEDSIKDYYRVVRLAPDSLFGYRWLGILHKEIGNYRSAVSWYSEAIRLNVPDDSESYRLRGEAKRKAGDMVGAVKDEEQANNIDSAYVAEYYERGMEKGERGEHMEAIWEFDKAIERMQSHSSSHYRKGLAHIALGKYQEAKIDFDFVIQYRPMDAGAYYNRAIVRNHLGDYFDAIDDYDKAIELNPNISSYYNNRGIVKAALDRHLEAIADYDKAIEMEPKNILAYKNRAFSYRAIGKLKEAEEDERTAKILQDDMGDISLISSYQDIINSVDINSFKESLDSIAKDYSLDTMEIWADKSSAGYFTDSEDELTIIFLPSSPPYSVFSPLFGSDYEELQAQRLQVIDAITELFAGKRISVKQKNVLAEQQDTYVIYRFGME